MIEKEKLFVGGLSMKTTDDSLRDFFGQWGGTVIQYRVIIDRDTGRSKGYGFVKFQTVEEADEALANRPHTIDDKVVDTKPNAPPEKDNRGQSPVNRVLQNRIRATQQQMVSNCQNSSPPPLYYPPLAALQEQENRYHGLLQLYQQNLQMTHENIAAIARLEKEVGELKTLVLVNEQLKAEMVPGQPLHERNMAANDQWPMINGDVNANQQNGAVNAGVCELCATCGKIVSVHQPDHVH